MTCDNCVIDARKRAQQGLRCKLGWHKVVDTCRHEKHTCILCGMHYNVIWGDTGKWKYND